MWPQPNVNEYASTPGSRNSISLDYPDGQTRKTKTKEIIRGIPPGTLFRQLAGGGGGYGEPRERPPELVLADVASGVVSIESAREDYGVWIDRDSMTVDAERTAQLRSQA